MIRIADTIHMRSDKVFSNVTAWATRGRREHATLSTHQAIAQSGHSIVHALMRQGVCEMGWRNYARILEQEGGHWCVVRPSRITHEQEADIALCLDEMIGWHYSKSSLALQFVDAMIAKVLRRPRAGWDSVVLRRCQRIWERGVICSETGNRPYIRVALLPSWLRFGSPDDTWDYQMAHSENWQVIAYSDGWYKPKRK